MWAELVDGVIGVDTHRDTHHAEIAYPTGAAIVTCSIGNDSAGYAQLLAWCFEHAPGSRLVICIEGTRSYGAGLARGGGRAAGHRVRTAHPQNAPGQGASPTRLMRTWPC